MQFVADRVKEYRCIGCGRDINPKDYKPLMPMNCPACNHRQTIPATFDHFRLVKPLGKGATGLVFQGFDDQLQREVAIKVLSTDNETGEQVAQDCIAEARALAALNHPNIVHIYSIGEFQKQNYIVMELVTGGSGEAFTEPEGLLDETDALAFIAGMAKGLKAAHGAGLVHMDVKPANVLVGPNRMPKLIDFGAAMWGRDEAGTGDEIIGTPYYIAPEVAQGNKPDFKADMYSLGATAFHLLTGKPPFTGKTPEQVMEARLKRPAESVADLREGLRPMTAEVISWMLERDPKRRYTDYDELITELDEARERAADPSGTDLDHLAMAGGGPSGGVDPSGRTARLMRRRRERGVDVAVPDDADDGIELDDAGPARPARPQTSAANARPTSPGGVGTMRLEPETPAPQTGGPPWMIFGIGVAVVAVIGILIAVMGGGGDDPPPNTAGNGTTPTQQPGPRPPKPRPAPPTHATLPPVEGPVAHWPLIDNAIDKSGFGVNADNKGVNFGSDGTGKAALFDGLSAHMTSPMPKHIAGNTPFTVSFRIKFEPSQKLTRILDFGGLGAKSGFRMFIDEKQQAQFGFIRGPISKFDFAPYVNQVAHVAVVYDPKGGRLVSFINGRQVNSSMVIGTQNIDPGGRVNFGRAAHQIRAFKGSLADVRFYNRPLNPNEVQTLAIAPPPDGPKGPTAVGNGLLAHWKLDERGGGGALDSSSQGLNGRIVGNPGFVPGRVGRAFHFKGNSHVEIAHHPKFDALQQMISISLWFKVDKFDTPWQALVTKGDSSWRLHRHLNHRTLSFDLTGITEAQHKTGKNVATLRGKRPVDDGKWHHAAAVYNGQQMILYIDGQIDALQRATGKFQTTPYAVAIGENLQPNNRKFKGMMDDVRIYARAITPKEVADLFKAGGGNPSVIATPNPTPKPPTPTPTPPTTAPGDRGTILTSVWTGLAGGNIGQIKSKLGTAPNSTRHLGSLENTKNHGNNFGQQIKGFLHPPATGDYIFDINGDDFIELYLSSDATAFNKKLIGTGKYDAPGKSETVRLEAGKTYYLEALMTQGGGGAYVRIGWTRPDGKTQDPVPGQFLSPPKSGDGSGPVKVAEAYDPIGPEGLVGLWRFEKLEGERVANSGPTGSSLDGVARGNVKAATNISDGRITRPTAFEFSGNGFVRVDSSVTTFGDGAFTIATWIKTTKNDMAFWGRGDGQDQWATNKKRLFIEADGRRVGFVSHTQGWIATRKNEAKINDGMWHHVAVVYAATGTKQVYVDGVDHTEETDFKGGPDVANVMRIGAGAGKRAFTGHLDDFRIYDRALNPGEIKSLSGVYVSIKDRNLAPVLDDQTVFVATGGGKGSTALVLKAKDPNFDDTLTYAILGGNTGNVFSIDPKTGSVSLANPAGVAGTTAKYDLRVKVSDAGGLSDEAQISVRFKPFNLDEGLVAYWTMDDKSGTSLSDSGGSGWVGEVIGRGARFLPSGKKGGGLNLAGRAYVRVPQFQLETDTFTFTGWVFMRRKANFAPIWFSDGTQRIGMHLGQIANPTVRYTWNNTSRSTWGWDGGPTLPTGKWVFVAMVIEPSGSTVYLGDDPATAPKAFANKVPHRVQRIDRLELGRWDCLADPVPRSFEGVIDEFRFYDRALAPGHIHRIMQDAK